MLISIEGHSVADFDTQSAFNRWLTTTFKAFINTNRHYDYDIFNWQINIHVHLDIIKSLVSNDAILVWMSNHQFLSLALESGQWFYTDTPVSSINKTDCHNITEILLKVVLNTITLTLYGDYVITLEQKNSKWY
jgi:hypothetical protein